MLESQKKKKNLMEMKNAFDGLISRLGTAEVESCSWGYLKRNLQNWKEKKKTETNKQNRISNNGTTTKGVIYA